LHQNREFFPLVLEQLHKTSDFCFWLWNTSIKQGSFAFAFAFGTFAQNIGSFFCFGIAYDLSFLLLGCKGINSSVQ
jgi:hypothetical protein